MNDEMDVNYHGSTDTKKIDINDFIKAADYHFILCFKHDKKTKKLNIEMIDRRVEKNFKIGCIDKAIDFLQILREKMTGQDNEELEELMQRKQVSPEEIAPFVKAMGLPPLGWNAFLNQIPPIKDEISFVMQTFDEYFKGIEIKKQLLAGNNCMVFKITSEAVDAKSIFNKFKFEFWDKYYSNILKAKIGTFTITFQFGN